MSGALQTREALLEAGAALAEEHGLAGVSVNMVVAPQFEYTGKTALTVVSPVSGKHYRFTQPGARLEADIRDRSWLAFVPQLKRSN